MELLAFMSIILFLILVPIVFLFHHKKYNSRLPPGSLGLPVIGQSLSFLNALKADRLNQWFQERITKHGPIWKAGLFGYPTVVLHGATANKFIYTCDGNVLASKQPPSVCNILGPKNILELSVIDHKRVRGAIVSFLKLEVLKQHVPKVDDEIRHNLQSHWHEKHEVQVQPLVKALTINVICSLLFGIERGPQRDKLLPLLHDMTEGVFSVPINLPFTKYNRGIIARKKLVSIIIHLIHKKREVLMEQNQQEEYRRRDLITSLLSIGLDDGSTKISEEEIVDNVIAVMVAGYDTTNVLLTCFVRLLANNKSIYKTIVQEHQVISRNKATTEALTWEDITKMKYSWKVATELMRIHPPATLIFRRAQQDIEYGGFIIPKGWQVLISTTMTHMDDNIFKDPTIFDPTRFDKQAPPPFSYVAFGGGPRMCPGIELAKIEALAMIHRLVTTFTWELVKKDECFKRIPMPEFDHGLLVQVKPLKETMAPCEA
ncbi:hypothetical protein M8C21_002732 [Ambrosia artemisiifolia]|uniref:Cytochrome P450 n=1 Tax=Ambrosia artemisiifolia TaxID=4212 RepID=A0AAD5GCA0_AMBAR|nr:hypothetical protein M8C21_002732 [Ambrosia artemisiifolia]